MSIRKRGRRKGIIIVISLIFVIALVSGILIFNYFNIIPQKGYSAEDFHITTIKSSVDFNGNGVDDYTDILLGARKDAVNMPKYDGAYFQGGYPPENIGVCTDVVWRAFKNAGYSLKDMVDADIAANPTKYTRITTPDPNIDFRRVYNLKVFFEQNGVSLTTDVNKLSEWQPGDIVTYGTKHIGIVSDKRNQKGIPFLIHNYGQLNREENALYSTEISGHFRFDASKLNRTMLKKFM